MLFTEPLARGREQTTHESDSRFMANPGPNARGDELMRVYTGTCGNAIA
jgi:hypothetical protein